MISRKTGTKAQFLQKTSTKTVRSYILTHIRRRQIFYASDVATALGIDLQPVLRVVKQMKREGFVKIKETVTNDIVPVSDIREY